jgi:hypothetical protein
MARRRLRQVVLKRLDLLTLPKRAGEEHGGIQVAILISPANFERTSSRARETAARPSCDERVRCEIAAAANAGGQPMEDCFMYAAIRQGKAKTGMAEELARRIKEGAIPIISDVEGFMAYYVVYAPDDTVTAISIFNNHAGAEESNKRGLAWIEENLAPLLTGPATAVAGPVIVHTLA